MKRLISMALLLAAFCMTPGAAIANDLPVNANPNLLYLGYYATDGKWGGNFTNEVFPYTNLYIAGASAYDTAGPWKAQLAAAIQAAALAGKVIYLHAGCSDPLFPCADVIDAAAPYWAYVAFVEVTHEADLDATATENEITLVKNVLTSKGLGFKPFGLMQDVCQADNIYTGPGTSCPKQYTGKNAPSVSFVGIEAYTDTGNVATLNAYLDRAKNNVPVGKGIFLVAQSYDRAGLFKDARLMSRLQKPVYLKAYNDTRVRGISFFAYSRGAGDKSQGGTRLHPELKVAHYQMAERILGVTFPVSGSAVYRSYLAEGAAGAFWNTSISIVNPTNNYANTWLRLRRTDGFIGTQYELLPPNSRTTMYPEDINGFSAGEFGIEVLSDQRVVANRLTRWDSTGYGTTLETGLHSLSNTWYFAEGGTGMSLYYMLHNPNAVASTVTFTFYLTAGAPVTASYTLAANARLTIDGGTVPGVSGDVAVKVDSTQPIVAERATYYTPGGARPFEAGNVAAGSPATATTWHFSEGVAASPYAEYIAIGNPTASASIVRATYYSRPGGILLTKDYTVPANSRYTIYANGEPGVGGNFVRVRLDTINSVPFVADRTIWWGSPWHEASSNAGITTTGTKVALAAGESAGPFSSTSYLLVTNTSASAGSVTVTLNFGDNNYAGFLPAATTPINGTYSLGAQETIAVDLSSIVLARLGTVAAMERLYGVVVESSGVPIVSELSTYSLSVPNDGKSPWTAGANASLRIVP
jgi:hypothetical protein